MGIDPSKVKFVIWTTTTWTLPANVAICVGPRFEYSVIKTGDEYLVMASELYKSALDEAGITDFEVVATVKGSELEYIKTAHPFLDRESLVIVGEHVTLESGTGCVHTAPGHGVDDYNVCQNYPEIPIICPVDSNGVLTEEAGQFAGLTTDEANKKIAAYLEENGSLFALKKIVHQYPHCWRCKTPILFRATDQWFCSVDDFKDEAVDAINTVKWIPAWGKDRITSMVRERKDWCISRQRKWGVPIPIFFCKDCGEALIDKDAMLAVADLFGKEGSNAWYNHTAAEILPAGTKCKECGCTEFDKEKDIMDVWFDSGSSHAAVLEQRDNLESPADLYLEGNDQYRGWFQSSLLTSVATRGRAPYKAVLTHGMILDDESRKMSKSLGNGISHRMLLSSTVLMYSDFGLHQPTIRLMFIFPRTSSSRFPSHTEKSEIPQDTFSVTFLTLIPIQIWLILTRCCLLINGHLQSLMILSQRLELHTIIMSSILYITAFTTSVLLICLTSILMFSRTDFIQKRLTASQEEPLRP